jgi:hypothetical protein
MKITREHIGFQRLTVDVEIDKDTFVQDAANAIAKELIANGCLLHNSEYDIVNQKYREIIHIFVGKKEVKLP